MKCVICGHESGYNRAVIDRFSGAKIGQLCMNCEREQFGKVLEYESRGTDECVLCQRDGHVAFPRYVPTERREGDTVIISSAIEDEAPTLCDEHFHLITDSNTPKTVAKR